MLTPPLPEPALAQLPTTPKEIVKLLVDTGAERTVIDRAIADRLGLRPIRFEQMVGVSLVAEDCPVYLMSVHIRFGDGVNSTMLAYTSEMIGMATPPAAQEFSGLLGRDFFRFVTIIYDGPAGCVDIHAKGPPVPLLPPYERPLNATKAKRKSQRKARRKNRR